MFPALDHMPKDLCIGVCNTTQKLSVRVEVRVMPILSVMLKRFTQLDTRHLHNRNMKGIIYFLLKIYDKRLLQIFLTRCLE